MTIVYNIEKMRDRRRQLRRKSTAPEQILWSRIRNRQLNNLKFRRQYGVGRYIIDFYCPEAKLAIEVDGDNHFNQNAMKRDQEREEHIKQFNITFLRFNNKEVVENINGVLETISKFSSCRQPHPSPLLVNEREN